jgi:hypothetical protein
VNSWFNTINGGCGTNSSNGLVTDPATGNSNGDSINGGGIPGTTTLSRGVWCDGSGSTGSITDDAIDGGSGNTAIAKMVTNGCVLTESGNTYTAGGKNSYGLWYENCSAGTIIENHKGVIDGIIYGGNGSVTSTGLKLKNCDAEVWNNVIDGGSAPTATGIDVDPSSPWIHNNTIRGSQAATTIFSATGVAYSNGSAGILGGGIFTDSNDIVGATGSANPIFFSTGVSVDSSMPDITGNAFYGSISGGQGAFTTGILITNGANPGLVAGNTISGGTATIESVGIWSGTSSWTGTVSANTISGGTCTGCAAYGIVLNAGTPTIVSNNSIDGGSARSTRGIYVTGTANPKITGNTLISGGTATNESVGIRGATASWSSGTVSSNTISGGTCTGCSAYGIYLSNGTPTIGPNNSISGGSGDFTKGIFLTGSANPTITGNTNISGGSALLESIGIQGATASWSSGTVRGNTISGGSATGPLGSAYGIRLGAGTPAIGGPNSADGNTISAGSGTNTWGVQMFSTPSDFEKNTITGGSGAGFDVEDVRVPLSGCINATGTKTTNAASGLTSPDDSTADILDSDSGATDSDVDGPFTFGSELNIAGGGNCLIGIDTGA